MRTKTWRGPAPWREKLGLWIAGRGRTKDAGSTNLGRERGDWASLDVWGGRRGPSPDDLVRSYRGTAYACANLCAQGVAAVGLRLYVETRHTQARPKCPTRPLEAADRTWLQSKAVAGKRLARAGDVEEVTDHPLLDLLTRVNDELDGFSLIELTCLYMEIVGSAYWWLPRNRLGIVSAIWVLQPQYVRAKRNAGGMLQSWEYYTGAATMRLSADEVLPFHMPNLRNPYHEGWSPLRAAYEAVALEEKERANAAAILENRARPDVIVSAKGEYGGLGQAEAQRLERRFRRKFRRGSSGGVLVISDEVDVKPLTFPPKDMQNALLHRLTKEDIANAFGVPMSLLQAKDVNRANAEAGHYQLARNAILPRCRRLEQRLSQRLCPLFDERLFVAFDNPVPEDREMALRQRQIHLETGVITINEARREIGREPLKSAATRPETGAEATGKEKRNG
ncbi:MAG: phage portal protein [Planctomycetes bacterium]|nr:phage portal protein [Planctomycetota bacterium]